MKTKILSVMAKRKSICVVLLPKKLLCCRTDAVSRLTVLPVIITTSIFFRWYSGPQPVSTWAD